VWYTEEFLVEHVHRLGFNSGLLNGLIYFVVVFISEMAKRLIMNRKGVVIFMNQLREETITCVKNHFETLKNVFRDAVWITGTEPGVVICVNLNF
jgi:hypothetical protein